MGVLSKATCALGAVGLATLLCLGTTAWAPRALASGDSGNGAAQARSSAASGETGGVERDPAWGEGLDCAACHAKEVDASGKTFAGAHAATSASCVACHDDARLAGLHDGVEQGDKVPKRLKKTEVGDALCLQCHEQEKLAGLTDSVTVLTDKNGTTVNPHDLPKNDDHATIACVDCHKAHKKADVQESAQELCIGCHHEDIYECGTCHKE